MRALGRHEEACASYSAALALEPRRADALNNLGLALLALGQYREALEKFDAALAIDPNDIGTLHNRANALTELGSFEAALKPCDEVLAGNPAHIEALNTRGVVLAKLRRFEEALASYDAALAVAPDRVDIQINRGTTLLELDRFDEALASFDGALAADPTNLAALINRGNACVKDKRFAEALGSYDRALAIDPDHAAAITDRGVALAELDRFDEALAAHEAGAAHRAECLRRPRQSRQCAAETGADGRSAGMLQRGAQARAGECRSQFQRRDLQADHGRLPRRLEAIRIPLAEKTFRRAKAQLSAAAVARARRILPGKTIFLIAEQGLGDTLNFVRYVPLVAARGARVILGVQHPLKSIAPTVPGVSQVFSDGETLPDFDCYCPLLSLPMAFDTELETIPVNIPYIRPYEERLAKWRGRLPNNGRLRVGICWAGSTMHLNDRNRSMPLERFAALFAVPGLDFISVQKEVSAAQAAILREHGVIQLGQEFKDFADTAAVVAMLDLLVTVDTSVAHLAGAMGKAVAMLVPFCPDFRWLLDRTDSPWYPIDAAVPATRDR